MPLKLILPKTYVGEIDSPLIFLVGPIKGAPHWQDKAIELISKQSPETYIVSPSIHIREEYKQNALAGRKDMFERQTFWERNYLSYCWDPVKLGEKRKGIILAWLPNQTDFSIQHPYARDTRGELGEARGSLKFDPRIKISIGAEDNFPGLGVIERNFREVKPDVVIHHTLEQTCNYAIFISTR